MRGGNRERVGGERYWEVVVSDMPEFPDAEYYSCVESETLEWRSPEEAIVAHFDYSCSLSDLADGCVVRCYRRRKIPEGFAIRAADDMLEHLDEHHWIEDLHNPDDDRSMFDTAVVQAMKPVLVAMIQAMADSCFVWSCEEFAKVELSGEQTEAILRAECPEWFEAAE